MNATKIEYLDVTWNPLAMRCTPVSEGCENCWHLRMCKRQAANPTLPEPIRRAAAGGPFILREKELAAPLRRRKPARIGVQFMGDLFHDDVPFEFIDKVYAVMALCPQHTFVLLTKRVKRARDHFNGFHEFRRAYFAFAQLHGQGLSNAVLDCLRDARYRLCGIQRGDPLPNVWFLTTVENQDQAWRIGELLKCPAVVHGVSIEPMLGPVELGVAVGRCHVPEFHDRYGPCTCGRERRLNWVICGGETGPGARPMKPEWPRKVRDDCVAAGVPFFFKRHGTYNAKAQGLQYVSDPANAGRLLDGERHREFPNGA